jgi:UDP-sugar transporter A1/2/3
VRCDNPLYDLLTNVKFFVGTLVVLFATYLYTKPEPVLPGAVSIASLEKTTIDRRPTPRDRQSDGARTRGDSTSRSVTPSIERKRHA